MIRGFILEPDQDSSVVDVILRFSAANRFGRDIVQALGQFSDVDPRLAIAAAKKEAVARAFADLHGEDIEKHVDRVFFESGSTVTYVANSLAKWLPTKGHTNHSSGPTSVVTNNAFAYLYLWLCSGVMCHLVPEGPPDDTYGGMYGPLTGRNREPSYEPKDLRQTDPKGFELITSLKEEILPQRQGTSLLIAASSGLQLSGEIKCSSRERLTRHRKWSGSQPGTRSPRRTSATVEAFMSEAITTCSSSAVITSAKSQQSCLSTIRR